MGMFYDVKTFICVRRQIIYTFCDEFLWREMNVSEWVCYLSSLNGPYHTSTSVILITLNIEWNMCFGVGFGYNFSPSINYGGFM